MNTSYLLTLVNKHAEKHLVNLEIIRDKLSCVKNSGDYASMWEKIFIRRQKEAIVAAKAELKKIIIKKHPYGGEQIKLSNQIIQDLSSRLRSTQEMREKNKLINQIKRDLLETSAKICMNPTRIMRLLEQNVISLDEIETLYDL